MLFEFEAYHVSWRTLDIQPAAIPLAPTGRSGKASPQQIIRISRDVMREVNVTAAVAQNDSGTALSHQWPHDAFSRL